ncbi:unnamed protein product, partial [Cyprideis torosa]
MKENQDGLPLFLLTVKATDPEIPNAEITYLMGGNEEYFDVNSNGEVRLLKPLDYDVLTGGLPNWTIPIQAFDSVGPFPGPATANILIPLINVNDNPPILVP